MTNGSLTTDDIAGGVSTRFSGSVAGTNFDGDLMRHQFFVAWSGQGLAISVECRNGTDQFTYRLAATEPGSTGWLLDSYQSSPSSEVHQDINAVPVASPPSHAGGSIQAARHFSEAIVRRSNGSFVSIEFTATRRSGPSSPCDVRGIVTEG